MQNRKLALKPEVRIFDTLNPAHAKRKLLKIILSYSPVKWPRSNHWCDVTNKSGSLNPGLLRLFYLVGIGVFAGCFDG